MTNAMYILLHGGLQVGIPFVMMIYISFWQRNFNIEAEKECEELREKGGWNVEIELR